MPLIEGVHLAANTPLDSRPTEAPIALADIIRHFPDTAPRGRRGGDGTAWCLCCDTSIAPGPRSTFCSTHRTERNTMLKRRGREEGASPIARVPADNIDQVVEATDAVVAAIGRATVEFPRLRGAVRDWVDDLMMETKMLVRAVNDGLLPYSARRR